MLQGRLIDAEQDEDDLDDEDRDTLIDQFSAAEELDQIRAEIVVLSDLVEQAKVVREAGDDSKLAALRECLRHAQFAELKDGRGRLLIFTEHRDTLDGLREHLERWGYTTCEIHGGMNPHERKQVQEEFRTAVQVCLATEAAGEGINLQFCHLMINYDLPWNPTRLEQRLGRIHRIGQNHDVYAFNFVATDSEDGQPIIEGHILHRLLQKLDEMREALEGRVFDVIGEVLSLNDVNLPEMLREAAYDPRRLDQYIDAIDRIDPDAAPPVRAGDRHRPGPRQRRFLRLPVAQPRDRGAPADAELRRSLLPGRRQGSRPTDRAAGRRALADRARPGRPPLGPVAVHPAVRQVGGELPQGDLPQGTPRPERPRRRRADRTRPSALCGC